MVKLGCKKVEFHKYFLNITTCKVSRQYDVLERAFFGLARTHEPRPRAFLTTLDKSHEYITIFIL